MGERFRRMVEDELSGQDPPSLAGLVDRAIVDGRRIRRTQTVIAGLVSFAAAITLALGVAVAAGPFPLGPDRSHVAESQPVPATPAAVLELLSRLLPSGTTSAYAGYADGTQIEVQVYLDRGSGPGMIRVSILGGAVTGSSPCPASSAPSESASSLVEPSAGQSNPSDDPSASAASQPPDACQTSRGGEPVVQPFENGDDCVHRRGVTVSRPDGVVVRVSIASCLAWTGSGHPPGTEALTIQEATDIASDQRFDRLMPAELVAAGRARFPNLPTIIGDVPR